MNNQDKNLVIFDADSLVYIVAYKFENIHVTSLGISALDDFIQDIMINTRSRNYVGFFGAMGSKNFRYDIAVTKPYKGNRNREKSESILFWEPILKERMEKHWKFMPVHKIEADDACSIAANSLRSKYDKISVATTDKDLVQIKNIWFFDYKKRDYYFCNETVSNRSLCTQLIMGDSVDNIAGCEGAGDKVAGDFYFDIPKIDIDTLTTEFYIQQAKKFYVTWHTDILKFKLLKKLEKEFLIEYKKDNNIKRFTANLKSNALKDFRPDLKGLIKNKKEAKVLFKEMYSLIKLLDTEKEGKKYGFKMPSPLLEKNIDWDEILLEEEELANLPEFEDDIDILDDL
jgi:5'-3' exonuclease